MKKKKKHVKKNEEIFKHNGIYLTKWKNKTKGKFEHFKEKSRRRTKYGQQKNKKEKDRVKHFQWRTLN